MKTIVVLLIVAAFFSTGLAQVGVNSTGYLPDPSAGLDVSFTDNNNENVVINSEVETSVYSARCLKD